MRIVVLEAAYRDIESIVEWFERDNPSAASNMAARILSTIEDLGDFPGLGHPGWVAGTREWLVRNSPYIIVYSPHDDLVDVIAVFHGARDRDRE